MRTGQTAKSVKVEEEEEEEETVLFFQCSVASIKHFNN
jgi:hypothetical protein